MSHMFSHRFWQFVTLIVILLLTQTVTLLLPISTVHAVEGGTGFLNKDTYVSGYTDPQWFKDNIPFLDCPNPDIQNIYYYRWNNYKRHITLTPDSYYVITEFLPNVGWAGKYNTISCAAGHHLYEGRWIHNQQYLNDYETFWFRYGGDPRNYSFWAADAYYARYLVNNDSKFLTGFLDDLKNNYYAWETAKYNSTYNLFYQVDDRDGMEYSAGGSGLRPSINSYMYGDATAISKIANLAGNSSVETEFTTKAATVRNNMISQLWAGSQNFFETKRTDGTMCNVREEIGFIPWYFNIPNPEHSIAWQQLLDTQGFYAAYGPTTCERRYPNFMQTYSHDCLWNGPSWPYATTQTLVAMANLLNNYSQSYVTKDNYYDLLCKYTALHLKNGYFSAPTIEENANPDTGVWINGQSRSEAYNHSTYDDLIITGLAGLRPRADNTLEVNPLVPATWNYFCLEDIYYHGYLITILYDRDGTHYGQGSGLQIFASGTKIASSASIGKITVNLPPKGWYKYAGNPVLGGSYGTCFDPFVIKDNGVYKNYVSWRPQASAALSTSTDGLTWSAPQIVLGPTSSGWEAEINRCTVVKRGSNSYHMWYTGQANGQSKIGYATSSDGVSWTRVRTTPVLVPDKPWEKVAVMCPHVIWDETAQIYKMWYSGGDQYEPDAIGYATSTDGINWTKLATNPIFASDPATTWEQAKVTACYVLYRDGWYYMFYIGFETVDLARIGMARSRDGITNWERYPDNPLIQPDAGAWDSSACYKPSVLLDGSQWKLWYNGRSGGLEQIGLATHNLLDLWVPSNTSTVKPTTMVQYKFDDGTGTTATDSSGNGNHGALNGPAWVTTSKAGPYALSFDGANDYVSEPAAATRGFKVFTVDFWVKTTESRSNPTFWQRPTLFGESTPGASSGDFGIVTDNGYIGFWTGLNGTVDNSYLSVAKKVNDNQWHHLVVANDGSVAKLYVDDVYEASLNTGGVLNSEAFWIGGKGGTEAAGSYHAGIIDELKITNTYAPPSSGTPTPVPTPTPTIIPTATPTPTLTPTSTPTPTPATTPTPAPDIVTYKFDTGSGTSATDSSGHGYHGTLNGPTWVTGSKAGPYALSFDGTNDYVSVPAAATSGRTTFTVEFWVKTTESRSNGTFWQRPTLFGQSTSGLGSGDFGIVTDNGYIGFWTGLNGTVDNSYLSATKKVNDNAWHKIKVVNNGTTATLYVDDVSQASLNTGGVLNSQPFWIGGKGGTEGAGCYHGGVIDEFRIY
jgi:hypothetical protein